MFQPLDIPIYISTSQPGAFVLKYFSYFFRKYWGPQGFVNALGYGDSPANLPGNIRFHSLDSAQIGGVLHWGRYMKRYFSVQSFSHFIFGMDDFMICRPVDFESLEVCCELVKQPQIGRVDLQSSLQYSRDILDVRPYGTHGGIRFLSLPYNSTSGKNHYRIAGAFSIWSRDFFLQSLEDEMTPWQWETKGNDLCNSMRHRYVIGAVNKWAIRKVELLSGRAWPGIINTLGIRTEDVRVMENLADPSDPVKVFKVVDDPLYMTPKGHWASVALGE
jgi:hypothetical protein